jgi:hypothetical protein
MMVQFDHHHGVNPIAPIAPIAAKKPNARLQTPAGCGKVAFACLSTLKVRR